MSKLGSIYVININKRRKDIFPVIYKNNEYIYCKVHGSNQLREFKVHDVREYEMFKAKYECGDIAHSHDYVVYVPTHVKTYFEWIKTRTPLERKIDKLKEHLEDYDEDIQRHCERIEMLKKLIARTQEYKEKTMRELEALLQKLESQDES